MLKRKLIGLVSLLAVVAVVFSGCTGKQEPGWEFMPDMYRSPAIQAYEANEIFPDSLSALEPPEGTVPRGFMAYKPYSPMPDGYFDAKENLTMPERVPTDSLALADGAKLYGIYCAACHGDEGDGQGVLVEREKFLGVPSYADRDITEGSIFHVVTYGRGMMGSHAAQVDPMERWKITQHVLKLRAQLTGEGDEGGEAEQGDENGENADEAAETEDTEDNNEG